MARQAVHAPSPPATLCREIGRIITRWAYLENYIQRTVWMVLGVSEEECRLAVREPRLRDRLELISDLAHIYGLKIDSSLIKSMNIAIDKSVELRDAIAHGVWSYAHDHRLWALTVTKGSWDDQKRPKTERKKKVFPEGLLANVEAARRTVSEIDAIISDAKSLHVSLAEQIATWNEKSPQPSGRQARNQG